MANRKDDRGRVLNKGEIQRKDKTYAYVYTDEYGNRNTVYSKTLSELREKEEQISIDMLEGINTAGAKSLTVNDMFDRYIKTRKDLKPTTMTGYDYIYNLYVKPVFGKKTISSVKYHDVVAFYQQLFEKTGLKSATIETVNSVVHPTFELAVKESLIRTNPSSGAFGMVRKMIGKDADDKIPMTLEEQRSFLSFCKKTRFSKFYNIFVVMLGTGCRIGELIGLRWCDVNLEERYIDINHTLTYHMFTENGKKVAKFKVTSPKTKNGYRTIPMIDSVYHAIMEEKRQQDEHGKCKVSVDGYKDFVFQNEAGLLHTHQTLNKNLIKIVEEHNKAEEERAKEEGTSPILLPHLSCHIMRHTFCSLLCENETNVKVIQTIMGHGDIKTTMDIYAKIGDKRKLETMKVLSRSLDVLY